MSDNEVNPSENDVDTVAAILVEVRDTGAGASREELKNMLRERLEKTSVDLTNEELEKLASQVHDGV